MPTLADRVRSVFNLNATDTLAQQFADQRQQALHLWRRAVANGAGGKPVSLVELQQVALAIGIVPTRLAAAFEQDVAAWKQESELSADAIRAEEGNRKQTILAEAAQRELLEIESRLLDLKRLAVSAHGSGMIAGQLRAACDRHRVASPRLWDDCRGDDPKAAAAALDLPAADVPPAVEKQRTNDDEAEWIADEKN